MSKHEKLLQKLYSTQSSMNWQELVKLLLMLGYAELQGSGSRVKFSNGDPRQLINLHNPHLAKEMPFYVRKLVVSKLKLQERIK